MAKDLASDRRQPSDYFRVWLFEAARFQSRESLYRCTTGCDENYGSRLQWREFVVRKGFFLKSGWSTKMEFT